MNKRPCREIKFCLDWDHHCVSSLSSRASSGESSDDDSCYDSSKMLREIAQALEASKREAMKRKISSGPINKDAAKSQNIVDVHPQTIEMQHVQHSNGCDHDMMDFKYQTLDDDDPVKYDKMELDETNLREWEGKVVKVLNVNQSLDAIANGDAIYAYCTGCYTRLGFPQGCTYLYCPICQTIIANP